MRKRRCQRPLHSCWGSFWWQSRMRSSTDCHSHDRYQLQTLRPAHFTYESCFTGKVLQTLAANSLDQYLSSVEKLQDLLTIEERGKFNKLAANHFYGLAQFAWICVDGRYPSSVHQVVDDQHSHSTYISRFTYAHMPFAVCSIVYIAVLLSCWSVKPAGFNLV